MARTRKLHQNVTFTVLYTSSDGQAELPANNIQTAQWTRSLTIDKVTGEELGSSYWTSNKVSLKQSSLLK